MSLLVVVAALVLAYVCVVAFVMTLLVAAKRSDADIEAAHRTMRRRDAGRDDRDKAEKEEQPAEIAGRRRAG